MANKEASTSGKPISATGGDYRGQPAPEPPRKTPMPSTQPPTKK